MSEQDELNADQLAALDKLLGQKKDGSGDSNAIQDSNQVRGSFLMTTARSIVENKDYRQELKTGNYTSPMKQMQMVLALDECRECGIEETLVIDLLIAQKAGTDGGLIHALLNALTHTSYTANYQGLNKRHFWQTPHKDDQPQQ